MFREIIRKITRTEDGKRLLENFVSLSILQGINYILPLITLPYLVRVLGPNKYGLVAFAQAFVQYFSILTDFGFNLSATREISVHRYSENKISLIFSSVMMVKLLLLVLSFIIMIVVVSLFERFRQDWIVYYATFGIVLGEVLFPVWFFQGMESMKYITLLNIVSKGIYVVCIFLLVRDSGDYFYVPFLASVSGVLAGVMAVLVVFIRFKVRFIAPSLSAIKEVFSFSSSIFLSRVVISLYTNTVAFIIGILWGNKEVAYYQIAYKLVSIIRQPWDILNTVVYPYMAKTQDGAFIKKLLKISFTMALVLTTVIWFSSREITVLAFGEKFLPVSSLLRVLIFILPLISIHIFMGSSTLLAWGCVTHFVKSNVYPALFFLFAVCLMLFFNIRDLLVLMYCIVLVDLLILIHRYVYIKKLGILEGI